MPRQYASADQQLFGDLPEHDENGEVIEYSGSTEALKNQECRTYIVTPIESRQSSEVVAMEVRASADAIKRMTRTE